MRAIKSRVGLVVVSLIVVMACTAGVVIASASKGGVSRSTAHSRGALRLSADSAGAQKLAHGGKLPAETVQVHGIKAHVRRRHLHKAKHKHRAKTKKSRIAVVQAAVPAQAAAAKAAATPALTKFTSAAVEGVKFPGLDDNEILSDPLNLGFDLASDAEGVAGVKDYVETVGFAFGVFDKASGAYLAGEDMQGFFEGSGLGAPCEKTPATEDIGYSSPHIVYDPQSDRYIIMVQVEQNVEELGSTILCIGASKTGDPVNGGWYYYAAPLFTGGQTEPKHSAVGMWTNGLYMTEKLDCKEETEVAKCPGFEKSEEFVGTQAWAFNRTDLESGAPLELVTTQGVGLKTGDSFAGARTETTFSNKDAEGPVPVNLQAGTPLPPNSSEAAKRNEYILGSSNTGGLYKSNGLVDVWQWHVNWENPSEDWIGQSKEKQIDYQVTTPTYGVPNGDESGLATGEEAYTVGPIAGGKYSNNLDTDFDYIQPKPQYTDLGGTESLWLGKATMNCVVSGKECKPAPDRVRWQQLSVESGNGAPVTSGPKQSQDYAPAPTTLNRWLPAIGVDKEGDMAVGYSGASKEVFPSLLIAGQEKVAGAATGTSTIESLPETVVDEGHGYQTGAFDEGEIKDTAFGKDSMSLDPNGCEMWFVGQTDVGSPIGAEGEDDAWATQVTGFHFAGCTASSLATELSAGGEGNESTGTAVLTATLTASTTKSGISGAPVTFSLGGTTVGTARTNSEGVATLSGVDSSTFPAGSSAGAVSASYAGASGYNLSASSASGNLVVGGTQTITFGPLAEKTYGEEPVTVSASASSGEPVTFTAGGTCSVAGTTVTITGAGVCTITASQAGNGSSLLSAPPVSQEFNIAKEPQTITATGTWTTGQAVGVTFKASAVSSITLPCTPENNAGCIYFHTPETEKNCEEVEAGETPQTAFVGRQTKAYDEARSLPLCTVLAESPGNQNVAAAVQPITVEIITPGTQTGKFAGTVKAKSTLTEIDEQRGRDRNDVTGLDRGCIYRIAAYGNDHRHILENHRRLFSELPRRHRDLHGHAVERRGRRRTAG
jgi:hypothetical protein